MAQENNKLKTKLFLMEQNLIKVKSLYELAKKKQDKRNSKTVIKNNNILSCNKMQWEHLLITRVIFYIIFDILRGTETRTE